MTFMKMKMTQPKIMHQTDFDFWGTLLKTNVMQKKMKNGVPCIYSSGSKLVVNAAQSKRGGGGGAWTAEGQGKGQSGSKAEGEGQGKCERTAGRGPIHAGTSGPLL